MRGILLVNMGTPHDCTRKSVQHFIGEVLADPLVMGKPKWMSHILAKYIIAPLSSRKSFGKYKQIWLQEPTPASPLLYNMQKLAAALEKKKNIPVETALRYGEPNIESGLKNLEKKCPLLHEVIIFPLYPQYAQSTTQSIVDETARLFFQHAHSYRIKFVEPYYNHPAYINALAKNARKYMEGINKVVFSSHSLPVSQITAGWKKGKEFDYLFQLKETIRLLCDKLQIDSQHALLLYSSQRGKNWLKPFLNTDIGDLPKLDWKKIVVISPCFPTDNLETLYDIDIEARELFMRAGGEKFVFVPSLNDNDEWVDAIWEIIS